MSSRDYRPKASEIFASSTPFFGKKATFTEAFPEISDIRIEVTRQRDHRKSTEVITGQVGEFIDCTNSLCYNGGVSIGSVLRDMRDKGEKYREDTLSCRGFEGSPKGRRRYGPCWTIFKVRINIEYKDDASGTSGGNLP